MKLSPTMQDALDRMGDGTLVRWPGGFWTIPGTASKGRQPHHMGCMVEVPIWHVGYATVAALLARGEVVLSKHDERGRYIVEVRRADP